MIQRIIYEARKHNKGKPQTTIYILKTTRNVKIRRDVAKQTISDLIKRGEIITIKDKHTGLQRLKVVDEMPFVRNDRFHLLDDLRYPED